MCYNEVSSLFTHDSHYSQIGSRYSHIAFLVIHKRLTEHYPHRDCNHSDSKICWQIEMRNCRLTWILAYKNITFLEFCQHKSKSIAILEYLMITCCRIGIVAQLRHSDCIGRHREYWSHMIKAQYNAQNNNTFNTYVYFNTPYSIKFILKLWKCMYLYLLTFFS